jgi:hypothetical protein
MNYIFFSTFVPSHHFLLASRQLEFYLGLPNTTVVIGDNASSCDRWRQHCLRSGLNYSKRSHEHNINSDAAGFFECLRVGAALIEDSDLVWFVHTKGFSTTAEKVNFYFEYYTRKHFSRLSIVREEFERDASIGIYSDRCTEDKYPRRYDLKRAFCDILGAPYAPSREFAENTFFCMRGLLIRLFIERASSLIEFDYFRRCGFDRWFFESEFPQIAPAFGFRWISRIQRTSRLKDYI